MMNCMHFLPVNPVGRNTISANSSLAANAEPIIYSAACQPTKDNIFHEFLFSIFYD
jgi:hypothetical protein